MGWLKDRLFGGGPGKERGGRAVARPAPRRATTGTGTGDLGVCDCCNAPLDRAAAYYLPTSTVVLSEAHWADTFAVSRQIWQLFLKGDQLMSAFSDFVRRHAAQDTPWAVCEACSEFFLFDRDEARSNALDDRAPDGTGAVDPSGCVLFAALGWERAHGSWPKVVERPARAGTCDFCEKAMYVGELTAFVPKATLERYEARGFTGHDRPVREPGTKDAEVGWRECQVCMARNVTRLHRADYRP